MVILLLWCLNCGAQHKSFKFPDSLKSKNFDYLSAHVSLNPSDSVKSKIYAQAWLYKAKAEKAYRQQALAYRSLMYHLPKEIHLRYADSIVVLAEKTKDDALLGSAYMTRGVSYYERKEILKALDNYLLADEYISRTDDKYLMHKVKFAIGLTKHYLGFYDEAVSLFTECAAYFEEENDRAYLNSLHSLGLAYNRVKKYDLCSEINKKGIAAGRILGDRIMEPYFIHSEGVNQYFRKNYKAAISSLNQSLPVMLKSKDIANEAVAFFYLGKSHMALHNENKAISYFQKVDGIFLKENYIRPDLRETYEILINHYKQHDDKVNQLIYIDRLLKVDSVLHRNYRYLSAKIFKHYDTKKLLKARNEIERSMQNQRIFGVTVILLLTGLIIYLIYRHYANQKKYRQKYEELMNRKPEVIPVVVNPEKDAESDLNPELVKTILKNLDKFEAGKKYLEKDMNLVRIAELLHTNTKYVTKIIQRYRGKGTIEYISDLKIDHIVELLKAENRYRNYTNKALADEVGFGSTQNFTRAFKARNVISPTYFIQELKKDMRE
jgi:AraC-like DNA-binding protein